MTDNEVRRFMFANKQEFMKHINQVVQINMVLSQPYYEVNYNGAVLRASYLVMMDLTVVTLQSVHHNEWQDKLLVLSASEGCCPAEAVQNIVDSLPSYDSERRLQLCTTNS